MNWKPEVPQAALIAIVDEDSNARGLLRRCLEGDGYRVVEFTEHELLVAPTDDLSAVCLGLDAPDADAAALLKMLHSRDPSLPVVVLSVAPGCELATEAFHHGAYDLLPKPLDEDRVLPAIRRSVERRAFSATLHRLRSELNHSDGGFLGRPSASHASSEVNGAAPLAAPSLMDSPVRSLRELEREAIQRALVATGGSVGKAARLLGMGRATLYRRLASSDPRVALRPVEMAAK